MQLKGELYILLAAVTELGNNLLLEQGKDFWYLKYTENLDVVNV